MDVIIWPHCPSEVLVKPALTTHLTCAMMLQADWQSLWTLSQYDIFQCV